MEAGGDQGQGLSSRARISREAGRCGFRRGVPCNAEVHLALRSGGPVDGAHKGHAFFAIPATGRLPMLKPRALFARPRPARLAPCSNGGSLRFEAGLSGRRQRLRISREPGLARQTEEGDAAHSRLRQIHKGGRNIFARTSLSIPKGTDRPAPAGKELVQSRRTYASPRTGVAAEGTRLYRASKKVIATFVNSKSRCRPNAVARKIPRDLHEDARDVARALASTPEYEAACRRRKKVGMLFAHLKRILRLGRLRLRGPCGAKDEFLLAATAQNLRRQGQLARLRPAGARMGGMAA
jgi:Transposase DDE domain